MKNICRVILITVCSIVVLLGFEFDVQAHGRNDKEQYIEVKYMENTGNVRKSADDNSHRDYDENELIKDMGALLRKGMKLRKTSIELSFTTREPLKQAIIDQFMIEALKHTGVPTEGDYLKGHYNSYKASVSGKFISGTYHWTFTYKVNYKTTAAQEKATDSAVAEIILKMNLKGKDSYTKTRAIYDYICKNVKYDKKNLNNKSYQLKHTAYAAAVNKTSVCQGYSLLLYRMLLENGIETRVIEGTGNGMTHSWNIVKINGKYYYLDATWDAGKTNYEWFLKGENEFKEHRAITVMQPVSSTSYKYIGKHEHNYASTVKKATFSQDGKIDSTCSICGSKKKAETIFKVKYVKLAYTDTIYKGNQRTPTVTVKDVKGKVLKQGRDYNLYYSDGRKNVGIYNVKILLKGNYSGSKNLSFTIRPKATGISSLKGNSNGVTVKYAKQTAQTTGYQIQYAQSKNFKSAQSVLVKKNSTVSYKIKGLKAKKTYWVRVRTYKSVKVNGKNTNIYSDWSAVKNIKIAK